jgi:hypothetical protein
MNTQYKVFTELFDEPIVGSLRRSSPTAIVILTEKGRVIVPWLRIEMIEEVQ